MSPKKTPKEPDSSAEEKAIEERVKQMLDPSIPDKKPKKAPFEVIKDEPTDTAPETAPEVSDEALKAPIKIALKDDFDDKPDGESKDESTTEPENSTPPEADESEETEPESSDQKEEPASKETAPETEDQPENDDQAKTQAENDDDVAIQLDDEDNPNLKTVAEASAGESSTQAAETPSDDTGETDEAVKDIQAKDSDELLKAQDEEVAIAFDDEKPGLKTKLANFFRGWWNNKWARYITIILLVLGLVAAIALPISRYFLLNLVGVRSSASITVLDESTRQPLRNVEVTLRGQSETTDENGFVELNQLKLGKTELVIERRAFAPIVETITIGWGSNPLESVNLRPVGVQYAFDVTDFLSDEPIEKAEAISGEYSAYSDEEGYILLTVDDTSIESIEVSIEHPEYSEEQVTITANDDTEQDIAMVPARKHVFVSNRSGTYDVYKIDADGQNEELILEGTGSERDDIVVVPHPDREMVAVVSTRNNIRNDDGFLMSTLSVIDIETGEVDEAAEAERIQIVGWHDDHLVYVRIAAGASAANPSRHRIIGFNYDTLNYSELARSNYFNDVSMLGERVYYAPSSAYQSESVKLQSIRADGSDNQTVLDKEVWAIFRSDYEKVTLSASQEWYDYDFSNGELDQLDGEPADPRSRVYADNPDGTHSAWIDRRDGQGVLLVRDIEEGNEDTLLTMPGLRTPLRWVNNSTIIFRVNTEAETADYAVSLLGGEAVKITDVTSSSGIDRWYHY
ncbi:MAG: hypothetical protein U5K77_02190 [Candidatus Saccharibacteria bacterium]|nr:hypothetical protein [Candidatus Saccharibacteria bacterium]